MLLKMLLVASAPRFNAQTIMLNELIVLLLYINIFLTVILE